MPRNVSDDPAVAPDPISRRDAGSHAPGWPRPHGRGGAVPTGPDWPTRMTRPSLLTAPLLQAIREQYRLRWEGVHGISHWARVWTIGLRLADQTGADLDVVELFAVFHDACRVNDERDPDHGRRGATLATNLRGQVFDLSEAAFTLLITACAGHTDGCTEGDVTIRTCWDADRLDLARVGIRPDPSRLCTPAAKDPRLFAWATSLHLRGDMSANL